MMSGRRDSGLGRSVGRGGGCALGAAYQREAFFETWAACKDEAPCIGEQHLSLEAFGTVTVTVSVSVSLSASEPVQHQLDTYEFLQ